MQTIVFICKTVTPLVMNGAFGDNPELRPPGIKASLRFWWRALHGHLGLDELRKQESRIFGSTTGRSKVLIRVLEQIEESRTEKTSLLPHKGGSEASVYMPGENFKVKISFDENKISHEKMKSLFILACTLGGWGKRSRRGFGSILIQKVDNEELTIEPSLDSIFENINVVVPNKYVVESGSIRLTKPIYKSNFKENYPWIEEIRISEEAYTNDNLLYKVIDSSHQTKAAEYARSGEIAESKREYIVNRKTDKKEPDAKKYSNFEKAIGDGSNRFASPVYVSEFGGRIIVTTLKSVPKGRFLSEHSEIQAAFKQKLLQS